MQLAACCDDLGPALRKWCGQTSGVKRLTHSAQIPSKPRHANADEWVSGETAAKLAKTDKTKRLALDLSEDLHRRIKLACTARGSSMVEEITKLLEMEFWKCGVFGGS